MKASQVERAPWKSYLTHMPLMVACVRERFKELVHEHCVTFATHKDLWVLLQLRGNGKISKSDFSNICSQPSCKVVMPKQGEWWTLRIMSTSQEFTCQIPYNENTGLERYMSYVANLGTRFDLMLSPHHHGGRTKRATFHPAHPYLHIPDWFKLRMG